MLMEDKTKVYIVLGRAGNPALVPAGDYAESIPTFFERQSAQQWIDYLENMWVGDDYYIQAMSLATEETT
jgi:hypothetical protein